MYSMPRLCLTVRPIYIGNSRKPFCKEQRSGMETFEKGFHQQPALQGYNIMSEHDMTLSAGLRPALGRTYVSP